MHYAIGIITFTYLRAICILYVANMHGGRTQYKGGGTHSKAAAGHIHTYNALLPFRDDNDYDGYGENYYYGNDENDYGDCENDNDIIIK